MNTFQESISISSFIIGLLSFIVGIFTLFYTYKNNQKLNEKLSNIEKGQKGNFSTITEIKKSIYLNRVVPKSQNFIDSSYNVKNIGKFLINSNFEIFKFLIVVKFNDLYRYLRIHTREDFDPNFSKLSYKIGEAKVSYEDFIDRNINDIEFWIQVIKKQNKTYNFESYSKLIELKAVNNTHTNFWDLKSAAIITFMKYSKNQTKNIEYCNLNYDEKENARIEYVSWFKDKYPNNSWAIKTIKKIENLLDSFPNHPYNKKNNGKLYFNVEDELRENFNSILNDAMNLKNRNS